MAKLKVTLKKSTIGSLKRHKANVEALGLTKIGQSKVHDDTPAIRGMIFKARHLLEVEEIE
ncbi:MAG TPA: 50S ribosomal protein L30 [Clostridiales bacterium]|nr:50S ribosomal protein L30 [Clostridiales bacterium]